MIDATLQELWLVKDKLAEEHTYDLECLVAYLKEKYPPKPETRILDTLGNSVTFLSVGARNLNREA